MVKVDNTRDYYADLELPQTCSTEEIKRQFHRLALLYHPDRNPGKELDYNARFQQISAANEVLSDPEQRQKYDANRRRGNVNNAFARPQPPRKTQANPYQATSNFPPPPRRANHRPAESPPAPPRGGAERYTRWAGGKPPPPPRERPASGTQDAKDRANAFSAWQHMNNAQKQHPQRRPVPPPPEAPIPPRPSSHSRPPLSTSPPKSAFEAVNAPTSGAFRPNGARMPRKSGFDPSNPLGDEGPPHSGPTMYSAGPRYPAAAPPPPAPTPPPPPPRGTAPTARRPEPEPQTQPPFREDVAVADPSPRIKTPYGSNAAQRSYFDREPLSRSSSFRDASKLNPDSDPSKLRRRSTSPPVEKRNANEANNARPRPVSTANPGFESYYTTDESSEETDEEAAQPAPRPPNTRTAPGLSGQAGDNARPPNPRRPLNSFSFPLQNDTFTHTSNPDLSGANVSPTTTATSPPPGIHRAESHPNMFTFEAPAPAQAQEQGRTQMPPPPPPPPVGAGTAFPADHWTRSVQEENWASRWADPQAVQTSPTRGGQNVRRPRGPGSRSATRTNTNPTTPITPQPASVEEEEIGDPSSFTGAPRAETPDANAMDIDDDVPSAPPMDRRPSIVVLGAPDGSEQPHVSFQEPSSSGQGLQQPPNNMYERRSSLPHNFYSSSDPSEQDAQPSRLSSQLSMDDFRNVYPLQPSSSAGLGGMRDLESELPFPSQASNANAVEIDDLSGAPLLPLPKLPKSPLPPQKLTQNNWAFYLEQMYRYLDAWNEFNSAMLSHFQRSASALLAFEKNFTGIGTPADEGGTGVIHGWLGAVGETKDLKGWNSYVTVLKEDDRWREHWRIGCDRHADAIERHSKLRQRILNGELKS